MSLGTSSGGWARRTLFRFVCHSITQHGEATSNRSSAFSLREREGKKKSLEHRSDGTNECRFCAYYFASNETKAGTFFVCCSSMWYEVIIITIIDLKTAHTKARKSPILCSLLQPLLSNIWQFYSRHKRAARDVKCECIRSPPLHSALETRFLPFEPFSFFLVRRRRGKKQKLIFHPFNSAQKLPKQRWMLIPATQRRPPCST